MLYVNSILVGIISGSVYSLIGVSMTLMYRSTGVLSIAHAAFAMVGAYLYADLAGAKGWSRPIALVVALAVAVAYGLLVERVAIRPVRAASATTKLIVTLGVLSFTTGVILSTYGFQPTSAPLLLPDRVARIGSLGVSYQQLFVFGLAGVTAMGLGWFLVATRLGTAIRAVAQNADAARLMGVSLNQVARINWAIGAALAGISGILIAPLAPVTAATFPLIVVKALTATLVGGLVSLPLTFLGGLGVGVAESLTVLKASAPGAQELTVLVLVLVLLFARRSWPTEATGGLDSGNPVRARRLTELWERVRDKVPHGIRPGPSVRLVLALVAGGFATAGLISTAGSEYWGFVFARTLFYVIEALSLVLLVGWAGQVSLMHGAYVGIGSFTTGYLVVDQGWDLGPAIIVAALVGMAMGAAAGIPALRLSGLQFAIASLAFSAAASSFLFRREELRFSRYLDRQDLFGIDLFNSYSLFLVMLPVTGICYFAVWRVKRSSFGALLLASRDAPATVSHFGADPKRTRMWAFLMASFIASLGGAFYGVLLTAFRPEDFAFQLSIVLLLYAVIGGIDSLAGPLVAGLAFGVLPELVAGEASTKASAWPDIIAGLVVIGLMAWRPGGLGALLRRSTGAVAAGPAMVSTRFGRWRPVVAAHNGNGGPAAPVAPTARSGSEARRPAATPEVVGRA